MSQTKYLRGATSSRPVGVDKEAAIAKGLVVAQLGDFKSQGRGSFDLPALKQIVKLGNEKRGGLKSHFTHANLSNDGLGTYLGRQYDFFLGTAIDDRTGENVPAARADMHFHESSLEPSPNGGNVGKGKYLLDLLASDPGAVSTSLVLTADQQDRRNKDGTLMMGPDGEPLSPLWMPTALFGSDFVSVGDAVDSALSMEDLAEALSVESPELKKLLRRDNAARFLTTALDSFFANQSEQSVKARVDNFLDRYLARRYGRPEKCYVDQEDKPETPNLDARRARMKSTT